MQTAPTLASKGNQGFDQLPIPLVGPVGLIVCAMEMTEMQIQRYNLVVSEQPETPMLNHAIYGKRGGDVYDGCSPCSIFLETSWNPFLW